MYSGKGHRVPQINAPSSPVYSDPEPGRASEVVERFSVEAILAVVMTHTGWSDAAERHRLDKQVDVDLVDGAAAERKLADEAVDRRLVATEDERRKGMRCRCNPAKGFVQRPVGQDRQDGAEDL